MSSKNSYKPRIPLKRGGGIGSPGNFGPSPGDELPISGGGFKG